MKALSQAAGTDLRGHGDQPIPRITDVPPTPPWGNDSDPERFTQSHQLGGRIGIGGIGQVAPIVPPRLPLKPLPLGFRLPVGFTCTLPHHGAPAVGGDGGVGGLVGLTLA